jgi:hypothetical protein
MEICGYENYLIYPDGRVKNKKTGKVLKQCINTNNYYHVVLYKNNGKGKTCKIHRLVALHYIPNAENKPQIDHINRDRTDNRVENLRWATESENQQNTKTRCNNKLGIKNISYHKRYDIYVYSKTINGKTIYKRFKTLEEAIQFKKQYESGEASGNKSAL